MATCDEFERELLKALTHLYDPDYQPSDTLFAQTGCDSRDGVLAVRAAIFREIEDLKPPTGTPPVAHTRRVYDVLHNRFVLKLTQEETAGRLHLSRSSIQRAQRDAVHTLAGLLWERCQEQEQATGGQSEQGGSQITGKDVSHIQASDWRSQVQRELASLQAKAPETVSDVGETINSVLELVNGLASESSVRAEVRFVQPGLVAAVHPVVLHQILISTLNRVARCLLHRQITIYAKLEDGNAKITLTGAIAVEDGISEKDLVNGIPMSEDVSIKVHIDDTQAFVWIEAPSIGKITVLAVDDNEDMARFYRGATVGTRYHIIHTPHGQGLFEMIDATTPDIIVLDIMLPDIDGWRLLMRLHENPATRPIPIVVCSVVREEKLALSLGAALYLPKPVRPREFMQALDQVLPRAATEALIPLTNSEEIC
jgi:CheY-like chemotaxis protein/predicted DNA-binding protein (UPF0251 family)